MSPAGKGGATTVPILLKRRNSAIFALSGMVAVGSVPIVVAALKVAFGTIETTLE